MVKRSLRKVFLAHPSMSAKTLKSLTVYTIVDEIALTLNQVNWVCGREESFFSSRMWASTRSGARKVALACTGHWRGISRSRQLIATTDKLQLVREMEEENMILYVCSIWLGCLSRNPQLRPLFDFFRRRALVVLLGYLSWYKP